MKVTVTLQWHYRDFTVTSPIIHTSQYSINNIYKTQNYEILLPKVILILTSESYEATDHTIPSHTPKRSCRVPRIRSFSLHNITHL